MGAYVNRPAHVIGTFGLCLWLGARVGLAVPAADVPLALHQPNGAVVDGHLGGDEWFNWIAVDGQVVQQADDGSWCYVAAEGSTVVQTKARAGIDPVPQQALSVAEYTALRPPRPLGAPGEGLETDAIAAPSGPEPVLVLLVSFSNRSFSTSVDSWRDKFFGTTGKTVRTYYEETSQTGFRFTPVSDSSGSNDGIVSVTLNYNHPNTGTSTGDANRAVVRDALLAADPYVNFATYDSNGNGSLSVNELHLVTVLAGYEYSYGAACGNSPSVWGHRWSLGFGSVSAPTLDGKVVGSYLYGGGYTQQGEWHCDHAATIGILCHELGHDIGLPDLYDTDGGSEGIGVFGLMGSGSWGRAASDSYQGTTPVHLCAWSKIAMGFASPTVLSSAGTFTAYQAGSSTYNVFRINTSLSSQYFLIENRQLNGFDAGFYATFSSASGGTGGGGLAIWHIDTTKTSRYPTYNDVNADETRKGVDIEEANEGLVGRCELDEEINRGNRHHLWYAGHQTRFADNTVPNSRLYSGASTGIEISNISAAGAAMNFTYGNSGSPVPTNTPTPTRTRTSTFTPTPTPVPPATVFAEIASGDLCQAGTVQIDIGIIGNVLGPVGQYAFRVTWDSRYTVQHVQDCGFGGVPATSGEGNSLIVTAFNAVSTLQNGCLFRVVLVADRALCGPFEPQFGLADFGPTPLSSVQFEAIPHLFDVGRLPGGCGTCLPTASPTPIGSDVDGDGVADILEGDNPSPPRGNMYLPDSDGDGLPDGTEDANRNGQQDSGETNPRNRDTDADGWIDGLDSAPVDPLVPGPFVDGDRDDLAFQFDPDDQLVDFDGDRFADGYERTVLGAEAVWDPSRRPSLCDIDGQNGVSNLDCLIVQSFFQGLYPYGPPMHLSESDANRDGYISNLDALISQSFFLGLLPHLPG